MCEWVVICVVLSGAGRVGLGCSAPLPCKESLERLYPLVSYNEGYACFSLLILGAGGACFKQAERVP